MPRVETEIDVAKPLIKFHKNTSELKANSKCYRCKFCYLSFTKYLKRAAHQKEVHKRPFKCEVCGFGFKKRRMLKDHITIHTGELPHECNLCQKKFRRIQNLRLHLKSHLLEKPFKCNICKREFSNLKVHRFTHFTDSDKPFLCEICGKGCATSRELKVHIYTHLERKPFECQLCERTFSQQPLMYNHMRRAHLGELPSKCGICGRRFASEKVPPRHLKTHSKVGCEHSCIFCDDAFHSEIEFYRHIRVHIGEAL